MSLPPLSPVPPAAIRLSIAPEEWEACLDAWLTLSSLYLRLPLAQFKRTVAEDDSLVGFLRSYYHESATRSPKDATLRGQQKAHQLLRISFRLLHRICIEITVEDSTLDWNLLSNVCQVHAKSHAISGLMGKLWQVQRPGLEKLLQREKDSLSKLLETSASSRTADGVRRLACLMHASSDVAAYFMAGSDFLDALVSAHRKADSSDQRRPFVSTAYLGLLSIARASPPNVSLLTDHLYSLKAYADQSSPVSPLLSDLVTNTPLITAIRHSLNDKIPDRLTKLLLTIATYRQARPQQPRKHKPRKIDKGKAKSTQHDDELHMHRMSLVSQVQDLFPDLGAGYVLRLLDEFGDDVEQVTAHLLDDALPPHLRNLDRTEQAPIASANQTNHHDDLAPRSTPPPALEQYIPERRNVFDDDELDDIDFHTGRLHIGKKESRPSDGQANKAAILSALAAFDSDDDERDDTYDVDDVGGTIDTAHPDGEPGPPQMRAAVAAQDELDAALFPTFQSHPELFGRSFDLRRGQPRLALRRDTGLTDEAIEGWALMLQRDPRRLRRLEARSAVAFDGRQAALPGSAYRADTESEGDSDVPGGRGGFPGRGRGRGGGRGGGGGGGRGGSVAGPSNEAGTAKAQRNKEANKSSRANHNRRDQRARKMARGGFPG